jgi:hypothetical protein
MPPTRIGEQTSPHITIIRLARYRPGVTSDDQRSRMFHDWRPPRTIAPGCIA